MVRWTSSPASWWRGQSDKSLWAAYDVIGNLQPLPKKTFSGSRLGCECCVRCASLPFHPLALSRTTASLKSASSRRRTPRGRKSSSEIRRTTREFLDSPSRLIPSSLMLDCEFMEEGRFRKWSVTAWWLFGLLVVHRWLVFSKPFFEGSPRVLEVGGYSNPASWGVEQPYVGSLHPLKIVSACKSATSQLLFWNYVDVWALIIGVPFFFFLRP